MKYENYEEAKRKAIAEAKVITGRSYGIEYLNKRDELLKEYLDYNGNLSVAHRRFGVVLDEFAIMILKRRFKKKYG